MRRGTTVGCGAGESRIFRKASGTLPDLPPASVDTGVVLREKLGGGVPSSGTNDAAHVASPAGGAGGRMSVP